MSVMEVKVALAEDIAAWDGQSATRISAIFERYKADKGFASALARLMESPSHQRGSTWLLKRFLESGARAGGGLSGLVYARLAHLDDWEAVLHVLQSMSHLPISERAAPGVASFLRVNLKHPRSFVRAWAYNGLYLLGKQHEAHRKKAQALLAAGLRDDAASVKARIRACLKQGW